MARSRTSRIKASAIAIGGAVPAALLPAVAQAGTAAAEVHPAKVSPPPGMSSSSTVTWRNRSDGKYLQIRDGKTAEGNWIDVASRHSGDANQHWDAVSLGYASFSPTLRAQNQWAFVNTNSDLCLSAHSTSPLRHLVQWSCGFDSYPESDRWAEVAGLHGESGYYMLGNFGRKFAACLGASRYVYQTVIPSILSNPPAYPNCFWQ